MHQADHVQLNSTVSVKEATTGKIMHFTIVTPESAEIRQKRISMISPMARALIGCRKGQVVNLDLPAGQKSFLILDVHNC
jgi:regulator of nucleoside diphosphate kinase